MNDFITLLVLSVIFLTLYSFEIVSCKKQSWKNKSLKKLSKAEVQVKAYLLPCSFEKEHVNSTSGQKHNHLHNCKRKLVIRMSVNSGGDYCSKTDGFIPIDHVIDGITGRKKRLLNPLMVRLKREKMFQLYDLQLVKSINAEPWEEVMNFENTPNYTGCDTSSSHPTCGFSFINNKIIQFSEGFCCSCDQSKNDERQPCENHSHESKDSPDMEYADHRHRSSRTNRDLEVAKQTLESNVIVGSGTSRQPADNLDLNLLLSSQLPKTLLKESKVEENVGVKNEINLNKSQDQLSTLLPTALFVDKCEDFKPALSGDILNENVTVKTFEFEQNLDENIKNVFSPSPVGVVINSYTGGEHIDEEETPIQVNQTKEMRDQMLPPKTIKLEDSDFNRLTDMDGDLNDYFNKFKHSFNGNSAIDREKFKLLVMKRIKDNKNKEFMNHDSSSNKSIRSVSNKFSREVRLKSNDSNISLNIENDNGELRLQIVTKKPMNITINGASASGSSGCSSVKSSKSGITGNSITEFAPHTENVTKRSIKQRFGQNSILKYFRSNKNKTNTTTVDPKCFNHTTGSHKTTTLPKHSGKTVHTTTKKSVHSTTKHVHAQMSTNTNNSFNLPSTNFTNLKSAFSSDKNEAKNISDIEGLIHKLIPVINTVHNFNTADNGNGSCKTDGLLTDSDNDKYNVYIELKKDSHHSKSFKNYSQGKPPHKVGIAQNVEEAGIPQKTLISNVQLMSDEPSLDKAVNETEEDPSEISIPLLLKNKPGPNNLQLQSDRPAGYTSQNIQKREAASNNQVRGGQCCSKKGADVPCNANPETYFESAHCLRFSDLWFNVFKLFNPRLENSITVKMYAKHKTPDKRVCWENLTKRLPGRVGTINEVLTDDANSIMIAYSSEDKVGYSLDYVTDYILVPQPLPKQCRDSELKILSFGGPEEYLVLKDSDITFDGEECDKAGVSYAAFARQLHRCQQEAGTCLKNQPLHYWRKDKDAARAGKRGSYFLKNFIDVTDQAILQNTTSNQVVLRAPYYEKYKSEVVIEMSADHIEIIGDKTEGQITEVYTDATSNKVTVVRVVVTNLGVASDFFGVDFANCSSQLGPSDFDKPNKDEIPPQHRITYTATISSPLKHKRVQCNMVLYNVDHQVVATRQIILVQGHRCMCVWHCQCVCHDSPDPGLPCHPLSVNEYNLAGFPGHLPVTIGSDCSTLFTVLHALLWFFLFLLLFGVIKAILGLCSSTIGLWGLWYILPDEARSLQCYLEPEFASCPVVRDCDGFPIHPHSFRRSHVHFLPWYSEFLVNVFYFICVFRSCLCDQGSHRGSAVGLYYQGQRFNPKGRGRCCCPPGCSARHKSPCGSVCSNRRNRKFRVSAGAEEEFLNPDPQLLKDDEWARHLVDELTRSYVVFRVLTRPMGGVKSVPGTPYCVRGFFMESNNGVYEFNPPSPLMQIWQMDGSPLDPPVRLDSGPFHALYHSAQEVLRAHELSPWARGVVINAP